MTQMDAVVVGSREGRPDLARVPIPRPAAGEVLIRAAAAAVDPSDLAFIGKSRDGR